MTKNRFFFSKKNFLEIFLHPYFIQGYGNMRRGIRIWRENLKKISNFDSNQLFMKIYKLDHWFIYVQSFFYICFVTVTVALPSRYHIVIVFGQRSPKWLIVHQLYPPFINVTHRYITVGNIVPNVGFQVPQSSPPSNKPNLARILSKTWQVVRTCKYLQARWIF